MELGTPIDWGVAASTGARLCKRPPRVSVAEIHALETGLAQASERARGIAAETCELSPATEGRTLVIDRPGWIRANVETLGGLFESSPDGSGRAGVVDRSRAELAGLEAGAMFGWLSSRVLGQYDPWHRRLLLVAPNVLMIERRMEVDPTDFRLWVCLHEETHGLQFAAAPWLVEHLTSIAQRLVGGADADAASILKVAGRAVTGGEVSLVDVLQEDPAAAALFDRATATMSLLEGHADVMMDRVGPAAIPTLRRIRRRFDARRAGGRREALAKRLLGLDAKLEQYRAGASFCRRVIAKVGVAGLNRVWEHPELLPRIEEIAAPEDWITRVARWV